MLCHLSEASHHVRFALWCSAFFTWSRLSCCLQVFLRAIILAAASKQQLQYRLVRQNLQTLMSWHQFAVWPTAALDEVRDRLWWQ